MAQERQPLKSKTGEELEGFREMDGDGVEESSTPLRPVARCKRCGCWLRAPREDKSRPKDDEPPPRRDYCSGCEAHMLRHLRPCGLCGDVFFADDREAVRCPECEAEYQEKKQSCASCGAAFLPYVCMACKDKPSIGTVCHACHWRDTHADEAAARERKCRVCGCRFLPRKCIVPDCKAKLTDICSVCHEETECLRPQDRVDAQKKCTRMRAALQRVNASPGSGSST